MAFRAVTRQEDEAAVRNNLEMLKIDGRVPCTPARGVARGLLSDINSSKKFRQFGLSMSTSKIPDFTKSARKQGGEFRTIFEPKQALRIVPFDENHERLPEIKPTPDYYEDVLGPENIITPEIMNRFASWMNKPCDPVDVFEDMDFSLPELPSVEEKRVSIDFNESDLHVPEPGPDEHGDDGLDFWH